MVIYASVSYFAEVNPRYPRHLYKDFYSELMFINGLFDLFFALTHYQSLPSV